LLAGGNPQIAKADGDAPVQAYIAAMPGWKRGVGEQLDALVSRTLPEVRKAVKWNSPFYGVAGQGWFLSFHCFTRYVKVTFFHGAGLRPVPPVASKDANTRYFHIHEDDTLDVALLAKWIRQAARLPGWDPSGERRGPSSGEGATTPMKKATAGTKATASTKKGSGGEGADAAQLIDERIQALADWRGEMLARLRRIVLQADKGIVEEWKWGVPVWSHGGIVCTGEAYKKAVKMTFAKGASLADPSGLFNSSLEGNTRRAIDFHEGDKVDEKALKALIREAVALNSAAKG
jgi:hypothetical protein